MKQEGLVIPLLRHSLHRQERSNFPKSPILAVFNISLLIIFFLAWRDPKLCTLESLPSTNPPNDCVMHDAWPTGENECKIDIQKNYRRFPFLQPSYARRWKLLFGSKHLRYQSSINCAWTRRILPKRYETRRESDRWELRCLAFIHSVECGHAGEGGSEEGWIRKKEQL